MISRELDEVELKMLEAFDYYSSMDRNSLQNVMRLHHGVFTDGQDFSQLILNLVEMGLISWDGSDARWHITYNGHRLFQEKGKTVEAPSGPVQYHNPLFTLPGDMVGTTTSGNVPYATVTRVVEHDDLPLMVVGAFVAGFIVAAIAGLVLLRVAAAGG